MTHESRVRLQEGGGWRSQRYDRCAMLNRPVTIDIDGEICHARGSARRGQDENYSQSSSRQPPNRARSH